MSITSPVEAISETELIDRLRRQLAFAELKIQALEEELRAERIRKYGPKSDTIPGTQLKLLEAEPGVSSEEVEQEAGRESLEQIQKQTRRPHPGRQQLPANLPRVERVIACAEEQRVCAGCGEERAVIGYDESEQLDSERRTEDRCHPLGDRILPQT